NPTPTPGKPAGPEWPGPLAAYLPTNGHIRYARKGSKRSRRTWAAGEPGSHAERNPERGVPVKNVRDETRGKTTTRRKKGPAINEEEEQILRQAQVYLLFEAKRPMLWTVAGIQEEKGADGSRRWRIAVHLRYPTGFEGYLGDLLYDGARITELTDLDLMRQRASQIAADPEGLRQWHEYRASTLPPGEA